MNIIFNKRLLLVFILTLLCGMVSDAANNLITQQITIKLDKAGTLPNKIGSTRKYQLTNLKIIGEINGTDLRMIREMAGRDYKGNETSGKLSILDLSEAKIVKGGDYYYYNNKGSNKLYYTSEYHLGDCAFINCAELTSITIPSSVTEIDEEVFAGCSGLTSLPISSSVTKIGKRAFEGCTGLTSVTIPSSVTSIVGAFNGCTGLTSVTIPSSVTEIGADAFKGCTGLTSVTIPSSVTSIDQFAFYGCSGLTSVNIPSSVTKISYQAFRGCSGLTSVTIPSSVKYLGGDVFNYCSRLTSVYVSWQSPISGAGFYRIDKSKCILYVPQGTYQNYLLADEWGDFENIVEYDPTGINSVTNSAETKEVSRYSMDGQLLSAPTKGVNIVKYSDGSVKKVTVK